MAQALYRISRAPNWTYVVEIGDPVEDEKSIRRAISGFKSEGEARAWIEADQRHVVARSGPA